MIILENGRTGFHRMGSRDMLSGRTSPDGAARTIGAERTFTNKKGSTARAIATAVVALALASLWPQRSAARALFFVAAAEAAGDPTATEQWRPVPPVVTPGAFGAAPSDAIILFDGKNLDAWVSAQDGSPARWFVRNGAMVVNKAPGIGNIETKLKFRDYQLHIEWKIPPDITGNGQARGNSGVFLASTGPGDAGYELQVLDSYRNKTYVNGMAGSLYKQSIPLANAARKPGEWQSYDVIWTAPRFNSNGTVNRPAYATVFWNGVVVDNHFELKGQTLYIGKPSYKAYYEASIKLQAHGDPSEPISFRNIWVRELP